MKQKLTGYKHLVEDMRFLLGKARTQAYKAVDNIRVQTYWQMGERIAREELKHKGRAAYSKEIVKKLAVDLGFSRVVLYRVLQFYKLYPIVSAVPRQLAWTHIVELLSINSVTERRFYEACVIRNAWSSRELRIQIKGKLFAKKGKKLSQIKESTSLVQIMPDEVFKDSYNFEFLRLGNFYNENDLERALLSDFEQLLFEFGEYFSLAGRQKKIIIDQQVHSVDLEFFNRGIPCIVLVDLKLGRFKSEYVGQMNKYLNYYRENKKFPWEKDPIGLVLCGERGIEEAHYALGKLANRIFVAEYKLKLPSAKEIVSKLGGKPRS